MNKQDLVNAIVENRGGEVINKKNVDALLTDFFDFIGDALENGDKVSIGGFGSFSVKKSQEREGRNPRTGAAITIAAANKVKFSTAKGLSDKLNP